MHHLFRYASLFIVFSAFGCQQQPYEELGTGGFDGDGGSGGFGGFASSPPTSSSTGNKPSQTDDKGFDPCPEDTYFLWEDGRIRYEITIQVFCEPVQNLNLGCPAP